MQTGSKILYLPKNTFVDDDWSKCSDSKRGNRHLDQNPAIAVRKIRGIDRYHERGLYNTETMLVFCYFICFEIVAMYVLERNNNYFLYFGVYNLTR